MQLLAQSNRFQGFSWVLAALLSLLGCSGQSKIEVPTQFERWKDEDNAFSIDYPADWNASGGGKNGVKWAEFSKGSVMIKLDFDMSSSLVGDIAQSQNNMMGIDPTEKIDPKLAIELAPVHKAHAFNKLKTSEKFPGFEETEPIPYKCGMGDARKSVFKSSSMFGEVVGYRSTALAMNNGVLITCTCSRKDWDKIAPTFDKILASLGR